MTPAKRRIELLLVLAFVAVLAFVVRDVPGLAHPYAPPETGDTRWFSRDADGLYHTRRVARAIEEGTVAERDPYLNYPDGAPIPWPPYYDALLAKTLAPFAPSDAAAKRVFLEHAVASAPLAFALATTVLVALAAWLVAGTGAALVAGAYYALTRGAINYQILGNGDHHAVVTLAFTGMLVLFMLAARGDGLRRGARAAVLGAAAGVLAGFAVGAWVASFVFVLYAQLALGWWMLRRAPERLAAVGPFALAFHAAAFFVLLPAVLASPWRAEFPWMVVNLSNFHLVELALGALISAPLCASASGPLALGTRAARLYPWLVGVVLALGGGAIALFDLGPAAGIREGFDWVSRTNQFMDVVQESAPLYGARAEPGVLFFALGYAAPAVVVAWLALALRAFRGGRHELAPWALALPPMALQALQQRRFSEAFAVPLAFALALGAAWLVAALVERLPRLARVPRFAWALVALGLVAAAQTKAVAAYLSHSDRSRNWAVGTGTDYYLAERVLCEWLHERTSPGDWSVLAHWDKGHAIEWASDRPTVATNFGSYVGEDSYRDPPRFFMSEDPAPAEAILERRRARYVLVTAGLAFNVATLVRATDPATRGLYLAPTPSGELPTARWFSTLGAQLLGDGAPRDGGFATIGDSVGYLRLVHASPFRDPRLNDPRTRRPVSAGAIWERVAGARVEAAGAPGEVLEVGLSVVYPGRDEPLAFRARATVSANGIATVRVPYATDRLNGEGTATGLLAWRVGEAQGELAVPESAVLAGSSLRAR
ncbi:MAG: hypothetical protein IT453_18470 [Planctomycetes bacterium]|nr:hypothetical protein [Planctomycetota bacterium]